MSANTTLHGCLLLLLLLLLLLPVLELLMPAALAAFPLLQLQPRAMSSTVAG
jgi:hypothetical protein